MGEVVYLDPWSRRGARAPSKTRTPEELLYARLRTKRSVGLELVWSHGVTGFVPLGDTRSVPESRLDPGELNALHDLVRAGKVARRSNRGIQFARYELLG